MTINTAALPTDGSLCWLDRHIIDQANHYGMSPARKAALFDGAAEFGELLEEGLVEEPGHET